MAGSDWLVFNTQEEYSQEQLAWIPISKMYSESRLDFFAAKPHGILRILDDQTSLAQARSSYSLMRSLLQGGYGEAVVQIEQDCVHTSIRCFYLQFSSLLNMSVISFTGH